MKDVFFIFHGLCRIESRYQAVSKEDITARSLNDYTAKARVFLTILEREEVESSGRWTQTIGAQISNKSKDTNTVPGDAVLSVSVPFKT